MKTQYTQRFLMKSSLLLLSILLISACGSYPCVNCGDAPTRHTQQLSSDYICHNGHSYAGNVIGDGHCVSLIKQCSNAPDTPSWRPGANVWGNNIETGSIIATFKNNRYPNESGYHAAIYISQDSDGIWVWDQWVGKPVHKRLIRWRNDQAAAANTAQSYRLVQGTD